LLDISVSPALRHGLPKSKPQNLDADATIFPASWSTRWSNPLRNATAHREGLRRRFPASVSEIGYFRTSCRWGQHVRFAQETRRDDRSRRTSANDPTQTFVVSDA